MSDLRTIRRDGEVIRMRDLRKGDRFKVETDAPSDHLHGLGDRIFTAVSTPAKVDGVWGVSIEKKDLL